MSLRFGTLTLKQFRREPNPLVGHNGHQPPVESAIEGRRETQAIARIVPIPDINFPRQNVTGVEQSNVGDSSYTATVIEIRHDGATKKGLADPLLDFDPRGRYTQWLINELGRLIAN